MAEIESWQRQNMKKSAPVAGPQRMHPKLGGPAQAMPQRFAEGGIVGADWVDQLMEKARTDQESEAIQKQVDARPPMSDEREGRQYEAPVVSDTDTGRNRDEIQGTAPMAETRSVREDIPAASAVAAAAKKAVRVATKPKAAARPVVSRKSGDYSNEGRVSGADIGVTPSKQSDPAPVSFWNAVRQAAGYKPVTDEKRTGSGPDGRMTPDEVTAYYAGKR